MSIFRGILLGKERTLEKRRLKVLEYSKQVHSLAITAGIGAVIAVRLDLDKIREDARDISFWANEVEEARDFCERCEKDADIRKNHRSQLGFRTKKQDEYYLDHNLGDYKHRVANKPYTGGDWRAMRMTEAYTKDIYDAYNEYLENESYYSNY